MPKGGRALAAGLAVIAALLLVQLSCINIKSDDTVQAFDKMISVSVATPTAELHDLAISAVDFDPALRPGTLFTGDNISLLVAVENKGNQVEKEVVVQATLLGIPDSDILVSGQSTIKEIVPGESQVVRFGNFSSIPLRSAYSLKVDVHPVRGETLLSNNSRTYRLEVAASSR